MFRSLWIALLAALLSACGAARAPFAGAVVGVSTLSADARAIVGPANAEVSLYKPENGPAVNLLAGVHLTDYVSVQGNYIWNRNTVTLAAIQTANAEFFEERRTSAQHGLVADGLLYFRNRESWARPYLSAGFGLVRFTTSDAALLASRGASTRPPGLFASSGGALRVAVGIDLGSARGWSARYSFSETISANPISTRLAPAGQRNLANFQNLVGVIRSF